MLGAWVLLALPNAATNAAHAQSATFRILSQSDDRLTVEVMAAWRDGLQTAIDSAFVDTLSNAAINAAARGGRETGSETFTLPALSAPGVTLIESTYEEVDLPARALDGDSFLGRVLDPVAQIQGTSVLRRRPVASLQVRFVTYDFAEQRLRRYDRLVFSIENDPVEAESRRNPNLDITQSALADGTVVKVRVRQDGMLRITRAFIEAMGLDPNTVDPNNVKVYGNGGAMLPKLNSADRYADLAENPVSVRGGGDGSFAEADAVVFYGKGPQGWEYESGAWAHYTNSFSLDNVYFVKVGGGASKRVGDGVAGPVVANFEAQIVGRHVAEFDEFLWSREHGSGRTWVSNLFAGGAGRTVFDDVRLPGLASGTAQYVAHIAIRSNPVASMYFDSGSTRLASVRPLNASGGSADSDIAARSLATFSQPVSAGQAIDLVATLENRTSALGAIDYVRVFYPKRLRAENGTVSFHTPGGASGAFGFRLSGFASAPQVWDVTEPHAVRRLVATPAGGDYTVSVRVEEGGVARELIAFTDAAPVALDPETLEPVAPQNLHGLFATPDLVLVTPSAFRAQADELADHRRSQGLDVLVVPYEEIVNEFGAGIPDMLALRDFLRMIYDRAPGSDDIFRYVLLFGDGHADYRSLLNPELTNWIPPYETEESFDPISSYTSDDYFVLLDYSEGEWRWRGLTAVSTERTDAAIGRLPIQTQEDATVVVRKLKEYDDPVNFGAWRSRYTFAADDAYTGITGNSYEADLHVQNADAVAEEVREANPAVNVEKLYGVSYDRVLLGGWRIPNLAQDIERALEEGRLFFNYSGHGGPDKLAQEGIFTIEDARALTNQGRYPIFITVTCSFGWWDLETEQSAGEELVLNPNGGSIASFTTVRIAYTSTDLNSLNPGLNRALQEELFKPDEAGLPRRLGDALLATKNTSVGLSGNSRKFNLLGDPSMRLGLPQRSAAVETINGVAVDEAGGDGEAPLRALDRVTLKGSVRALAPGSEAGAVDASFDGTAEVVVYDAVRRVPITQRSYMPTPYYIVREDLIWRGEVPVSQGRFEATFVVPKDISYSDQLGRIAVYARSPSGVDGSGANERVRVGGTADNPPSDAEGPRINLFLGDTTFVSGGLVPSDAELIVDLFDESGINTVGAGVGHELLLVVNGDERSAVDISRGFRAVPGSYQRGQVRWPLDDLPEGSGTLEVRAWDVLNNSAKEALDFTVADAADLRLRNVLNYPNPTNGPTRFVFEHNQPLGTPVEVDVRVYTLSGRVVKTIEALDAVPSGTLSAGPVQVPWDGLDDDGDALASGIYLYRVRVRIERPDGSAQVSERIEKLAVIR